MSGGDAPTGIAADPWRTGWFCVAPAAAVANDGDHVTIDLPDLSITIQNFRGTLAGFRNVCSHRSAQIRPCGRGRGMLRCPYHGWTYNREGAPVGIPENEALFGLSAEEKRKLALHPVSVALYGPLLFARVAPSGETLERALGPAAAWLQDASCVAERVTALDAPWVPLLDRWKTSPVLGERIVFSNLMIDRRGDWTLARSVLPSSEARTMIQLALFQRDGSAREAAPGDLVARFEQPVR